jgi:hypothetical protein
MYLKSKHFIILRTRDSTYFLINICLLTTQFQRKKLIEGENVSTHPKTSLDVCVVAGISEQCSWRV